MATQKPAVDVHDIPGGGGMRAQLVDDRDVTAFGDEADVLAVGLVGNGQAQFGGDRSHL